MKPTDYLEESPLMTVKQASKHLTLSVPQIYLMVKSNQIPYIRLSKRRIALHKRMLDEWLMSKLEKVN